MALDKSSSVPLFLQLAQQLREQIDSGHFAASGQIPSELQLAERNGISRMTARRAIDELVSEGLLYRRAGKGTFVAKKTPYPPLTRFSFSTAMRKLGHTVTTQVLELQLEEATPSTASELLLDPTDQVVRLTRLRFVNAIPAALHTSFFPADRFAGLLDMREALQSQPLARSMEEASGLRVGISQDIAEVVAASSRVAELLGIKRDSPLLLIRGLAYTTDGYPLRQTTAFYRGDRFQFLLTSGGDFSLEFFDRSRT